LRKGISDLSVDLKNVRVLLGLMKTLENANNLPEHIMVQKEYEALRLEVAHKLRSTLGLPNKFPKDEY